MLGSAMRTLGRNLISREYSSGRKRAVNVRKINPKVPFSEAASIAKSLHQVLSQHGPLSNAAMWSHVQGGSISGLNSKNHMKIMLKWMRGWKMVKLVCNHVGTSKKFLHCSLPPPC